MKYFLLFISFFLILKAQAQVFIDPSMKKAPYTFKWIEKGKTAMLETEVTVEQYIYYLSELKRDSSEEKFVSAIPAGLYRYYGVEERKYELDKIKFEEDQKFTDKKSLNNPYNKPITNISYTQAVNYCIWYTFKANSKLNDKKGYAGKVIIFRLPTEDEFRRIAMQGIYKAAALKKVKDVGKYVKDQLACINDKGCALCNHSGKGNCEGNMKLTAIYGNELYPAATFFANGYGLYDLQGNAAEMVKEENRAMGGSYKDAVKDCRPESFQYYPGPKPWLGFRLFAEVVEVDGKNIEFIDSCLFIKGLNK